jgi:hypothetical protein
LELFAFAEANAVSSPQPSQTLATNNAWQSKNLETFTAELITQNGWIDNLRKESGR